MTLQDQGLARLAAPELATTVAAKVSKAFDTGDDQANHVPGRRNELAALRGNPAVEEHSEAEDDRPLSEQVKEWILDQIFAGTMQPDERIIEAQVARELGVSHAPVREALRGLESLGVVDIRPFSGARVHRQTHQEIIDAYTVRKELEALAVRIAVERGSDLAALPALLGDMYYAAANSDLRRLAEADTRFHEAIVEASGNAELYRVWRGMQPRLRAYITLVSPGSDPHWTVALHPPILEGLMRGDSEAAIHALIHHFDAARERLEVGLETQTEDGAEHGSNLENA